MSTYILAPDAFDEPTIWKDNDGFLEPIIMRCVIDDPETWDRIVAALCSKTP